jgi:alanine racemase
VSALNEFSLREALIDTGAIRENAAVLAARAGDRPLLADVAGDGYGHGAVESAGAALDGGAVWLGVSNLADASELRRAGIRAPILASYPVDPLAAEELGVTTGSLDLERAEAALYGLGDDAELRAAMRVSARVVGTKMIERDEGVSYGYTYRATARTSLALVALGYADGLDRSASNLGTLWLAGKPRLIAGRVAMNAHVLELGFDSAAIGDEAVLFGDASVGEPSALDWAAHLGKGAAEVVSVLGAKLPRRYL